MAHEREERDMLVYTVNFRQAEMHEKKTGVCVRVEMLKQHKKSVKNLCDNVVCQLPVWGEDMKLN